MGIGASSRPAAGAVSRLRASRPDTACVRRALASTGPSRHNSVFLASSATSTSRRGTCDPLRASVEPSWPASLDTDGTVNNTGSVQFSVSHRRLAEDFRELLMSLGYRCGWAEKPVKGRTTESSISYVVTFTTTDDVFWLARKRVVHEARRPARVTARTRRRYITAARPIPSRPVRCVQVDSADRLYLASRSMIPTHNSTLALDLARAASVHAGQTAVIFSLEMSRNEITMRLLSAEARVALHHMRTGQLSDDDWTRLARRIERGRRRPAIHRRLAEHVDDGDPGQVPPAQAAARPEAGRHRLPAADELAASGSRTASRRSPSSPGR